MGLIPADSRVSPSDSDPIFDFPIEFFSAELISSTDVLVAVFPLGRWPGLSQFGQFYFTRAAGMQATLALADIDFIEELRLRRWARENYVPTDEREESWHPVVLDEMRNKDQDGQESD